MMDTNDLINYYPDLLIIQYIGKPRAYAMMKALVTPVVMPQTTVETISFPLVPDAGAFTLFYLTTQSASINWNDSAATIQTTLRAISGLGSITVTGSIASRLLTITFIGVTPPAAVLTLGANTLTSSGNPVVPDIEEIDETLPNAVQDGFNLTGNNKAVGVQLDTLGKYVGVVRTNPGFTMQITLNDADFLTLIQIKTVQNSAGSSTFDIVSLLNTFFPQEIFLFDRQTMEFDYYVSTAFATLDLLQVFIVGGFLPKPMGVRIRLVIYFPVLNTFFGFRTYSAPAFNSSPFNTYTTYHTNYPWLIYSYAIII